MSATRISRPEDIGAIFRAYRREHKLSQTDLADRLSVSQRWVSHVENGKPTLQLGLVLRVFNELGIELTAGRTSTKAAAPERRRSGKNPTDIDSIVDD
jgi:y4mF family transcriptional regulator